MSTGHRRFFHFSRCLIEPRFFYVRRMQHFPRARFFGCPNV
jgi:hypothetical protein